MTSQFTDVAWAKSSYSGNSTACVEIAVAASAVGVRDTKRRDGGVLAVSAASWSGLRSAVEHRSA